MLMRILLLLALLEGKLRLGTVGQLPDFDSISMRLSLSCVCRMHNVISGVLDLHDIALRPPIFSSCLCVGLALASETGIHSLLWRM